VEIKVIKFVNNYFRDFKKFNNQVLQDIKNLYLSLINNQKKEEEEKDTEKINNKRL
jgi:hypothetical protein